MNLDNSILLQRVFLTFQDELWDSWSSCRFIQASLWRDPAVWWVLRFLAAL